MVIEKEIEYFHPDDFVYLQGLGNHRYDEASLVETAITGVVGYVGKKVIKLSFEIPIRGKKWVNAFINEHLITN